MNLAYETLQNRVGSGLLISMLEKLNLFRLTSLITFDVKIDGKIIFYDAGTLSLLHWVGVLTLPALPMLPPRKLEPRFMKFFSPEVALYL